jgi:hypothetical protein
MSKRTLREFLNGPGKPKVHKGYGKPQIVTPDVTTKAQEDLTQLVEMEAEAKAEQERADQDSAEAAEGNVPGSISAERPPMSFSGRGIDG